jgi:hypothetical protein
MAMHDHASIEVLGFDPLLVEHSPLSSLKSQSAPLSVSLNRITRSSYTQLGGKPLHRMLRVEEKHAQGGSTKAAAKPQK